MIEFVKVVRDDMDGSEGASTIVFAFEGTPYEIDLNEKHAEKFRAEMSKWIDAARRAGGRQKVKSKTSAPSEQLQAIRDWAKSQGMNVSDRGRIPNDVLLAFNQSHKKHKSELFSAV